MSTERCIYGAEYVSDLVPIAPQRMNKPPLYHSRHRFAVRREEHKNKYPAKTMGKIHTTPPNPQRPMMKGKGFNATYWEKQAQQVIASPRKTLRKPPVPSVKELKPNRRIVTQFSDKIKQNAIRNISAVPTQPKEIYVDTKNGNKNDLLGSGLVPNFKNKANYGKVPDYIKRRRLETKQAQETYDAFFEEQVKANQLYKLNAQETSNILLGLKSKWDNLYHQYQGLSVVTDTAPKKNRKERLENEMSQLERDISLLERHSTILIEKH